MKKIIFIALTLLILCCSLTSCAAGMSMPYRDDFMTDRSGRTPEDGTAADGENDRIGAGDYLADSDGRVRSYNSDNDASF